MTDIAFSEAPLFGDEPEIPTAPFTPSAVPQDRSKKKKKKERPAGGEPRQTVPDAVKPAPAPEIPSSAVPKVEPVADSAPAAAPSSKKSKPRDVMEIINAISDIVEEFPDHANSIAYMAQRLQKITNNEMFTYLIMVAVTVVIEKAALKEDTSTEVDHE